VVVADAVAIAIVARASSAINFERLRGEANQLRLAFYLRPS
jgi:hypothetical protein